MDELMNRLNADRRSFIQRILGMAGFAVPTVRSFVIGSAATVAAVGPGMAQTTVPLPTTISVSTTRLMTTVMRTTTSSPVTTARIPTTTGFPILTTPIPSHIPEIDSSSAGAAIAVLTGAALVARGYRRSKPVPSTEATSAGPEKEPGREQ